MKEQNRENRAETAASFKRRKNKTKGSAPRKAKHCSNIPVVCLWAFD